jgi:hypothetical protein
LLLKPSKPHVAQLPPALPRLKNPPAPEPLLLPLPIHEHEGNTGPHLRTVTYEHAKRAAPGWDVYELERQWREWIEKKGPPQKPDAAFVAFCRNKLQTKNQKRRRQMPAKSKRLIDVNPPHPSAYIISVPFQNFDRIWLNRAKRFPFARLSTAF